jgi:DNA-binding NarL/FixJ family response regulator
MQSITVAIVEINQKQRVPIEELLRPHETNVELLTDVQSNYDNTVERRCIRRNDITPVDNAIARIKRLNPSILFVNAHRLMGEYCDLLLALQYQCPNTQAILILDEPIEEDYLLETLSCGARGYITNDWNSVDFSKVVMAVHRGEAWLPRKMIGKVMQQIVSASHYNFSESDFDSLG